MPSLVKALSSEIDSFIVIYALEHHHVYLDRVQSGPMSRLDTGEYLPQFITAGDAFEPVRFQCIQADVGPLQSGFLELSSALTEQYPVGGKRDIVDTRYLRD